MGPEDLFPALRELCFVAKSVVAKWKISKPQIQELTALASHLSHTALHTQPRPPAATIANYASAINGHVLLTLFCFVNLTEVILAPPVDYHPSSMTLHGVRAFAKHYRNLASLTVIFDASTVPPFDNSSDSVIPQSSLTSLATGTSPITDQVTIAPFLSGLFSNLRRVYP
ncbi:hypothetical protein B0H13DRAFT_2308370 [Mycena leptocephala]|nr:hypothetical protein B0H13DRAFT_2308370 [Mycena leptocephala]